MGCRTVLARELDFVGYGTLALRQADVPVSERFQLVVANESQQRPFPGLLVRDECRIERRYFKLPKKLSYPGGGYFPPEEPAIVLSTAAKSVRIAQRGQKLRRYGRIREIGIHGSWQESGFSSTQTERKVNFYLSRVAHLVCRRDKERIRMRLHTDAKLARFPLVRVHALDVAPQFNLSL